ncbi:MAG: hypothetical protein FJ116_02230 [Deltaproteobacteria bacterium]|nr:hypothetical protein [Deltaproteobacteria bacterium]
MSLLSVTLILFAHHFVTKNIKNKFELLKQLNKKCNVKAIGFKDNKDLLLGSIIVDTKKYPNNKNVSIYFNKHVNWTEADLFLYEAYFLYPNYKKYFLLEYDTIFNTSIEEFFPINKYNHFGSNIFNNVGMSWEFCRIYKEENKFSLGLEELASIGQTSCIYINNNLLSKISKEIIEKKEIYESMFSELRLGTLVKKFNGYLIKSRGDIDEYISWTEDGICVDIKKEKYFYHPVKTLE